MDKRFDPDDVNRNICRQFVISNKPLWHAGIYYLVVPIVETKNEVTIESYPYYYVAGFGHFEVVQFLYIIMMVVHTMISEKNTRYSISPLFIALHNGHFIVIQSCILNPSSVSIKKEYIPIRKD